LFNSKKELIDHASQGKGKIGGIYRIRLDPKIGGREKASQKKVSSGNYFFLF